MVVGVGMGVNVRAAGVSASWASTFSFLSKVSFCPSTVSMVSATISSEHAFVTLVSIVNCSLPVERFCSKVFLGSPTVVVWNVSVGSLALPFKKVVVVDGVDNVRASLWMFGST